MNSLLLFGKMLYFASRFVRGYSFKLSLDCLIDDFRAHKLPAFSKITCTMRELTSLNYFLRVYVI